MEGCDVTQGLHIRSLIGSSMYSSGYAYWIRFNSVFSPALALRTIEVASHMQVPCTKETVLDEPMPYVPEQSIPSVPLCAISSERKFDADHHCLKNCDAWE